MTGSNKEKDEEENSNLYVAVGAITLVIGAVLFSSQLVLVFMATNLIIEHSHITTFPSWFLYTGATCLVLMIDFHFNKK